jgi:hypothetical protein
METGYFSIRWHFALDIVLHFNSGHKCSKLLRNSSPEAVLGLWSRWVPMWPWLLGNETRNGTLGLSSVLQWPHPEGQWDVSPHLLATHFPGLLPGTRSPDWISHGGVDIFGFTATRPALACLGAEWTYVRTMVVLVCKCVRGWNSVRRQDHVNAVGLKVTDLPGRIMEAHCLWVQDA